MKNHYMIDLETMGIRPTSAVVSIGIVRFNQEELLETFYTPVSLANCYELGMTFDQSTVDWWARQSVEARAAWQVENAPTVQEALTKMVAWMGQFGHVKQNAVWGNGVDFDIVLLNHMFNLIEADAPWMYYNHHCFRTMRNMFEVSVMPRQGTYHNALDDAVTQAQHLQRILKIHRIALP